MKLVMSELNDRIEKLVAALEPFIDDEKCSYDHHGYCQTHGLGNPCEQIAARAALKQAKGASIPEPVIPERCPHNHGWAECLACKSDYVHLECNDTIRELNAKVRELEDTLGYTNRIRREAEEMEDGYVAKVQAQAETISEQTYLMDLAAKHAAEQAQTISEIELRITELNSAVALRDRRINELFDQVSQQAETIKRLTKEKDAAEMFCLDSDHFKEAVRKKSQAQVERLTEALELFKKYAPLSGDLAFMIRASQSGGEEAHERATRLIEFFGHLDEAHDKADAVLNQPQERDWLCIAW